MGVGSTHMKYFFSFFPALQKHTECSLFKDSQAEKVTYHDGDKSW